jgi:predicted DNA-binding transcriptional regulator AlpA
MAQWKMAIMPRTAVEADTRTGHSKLYLDIRDRKMTPPVSVGGSRSKGWLEYEIAALLAAYAAEASQEDLRWLVEELIVARTAPDQISEARRLVADLVKRIAQRNAA